MIEVKGPDGRTHVFAEGTDTAQVEAAMAALYPVPPVPPVPPVQPTTSPSEVPTWQQKPQETWPTSATVAQENSGAVGNKGISTLQIIVGALVAAVLTMAIALAFLVGRGNGKVPQTPPSTPVPITTPTVSADPVVTPEAFSGFIATQQGGNLNVRSQPNQNALPLAKLPHGAPVNVTGSVLMADGLWRQVNVAGTVGYVKGDYISQTQPAAIAPVQAAPMVQLGIWGTAVTQRSATVNMRGNPTLNARVIASIPYGASVYIVAQQGNWYLIDFGGRRGWANASYIRR